MKLIALRQAVTLAMNCRISKGSSVMEFLTFKRDRGLEVRTSSTGFTIKEHGFEASEQSFSSHTEFKKALKEAFKREFPRSHEVYFKRTEEEI